MMKFDKIFTIQDYVDYPYRNHRNEERGCAWGKITIGNFYEYFYMSPSVWKISDYEKQWDVAWERLQAHDTACFITNVQRNPLIEMWALYKVDHIIYIQNFLMAQPHHQKIVDTLNLKNSFDIIPKREILTEEGKKISEWSVKIINDTI